MNCHVNAIAGRLSLRPPQRRSLEILDRVTEIVPPRKGAEVQAALDAIRAEFPTVTFTVSPDLEAQLRELPDADATISWPHREALPVAKKLRWSGDVAAGRGVQLLPS